jgi:hypothetical protein
MHPPHQSQAGFKRQVVFRIDADDWTLLEAAAAEHGSIQAAVLAGIRALTPSTANEAQAEHTPEPAKAEPTTEEKSVRQEPIAPAATATDPGQEIPAREAAALLGLKTSTVSGYIRSGRLSGRYDGEPNWRGWLTTPDAVAAYRTAHPRV